MRPPLKSTSNKSLQIMYNTIVFILCILSIIFAILDMTKGLSSALMYADRIVYGVFVAEYCIRLFTAEGKRNFFRENVFDLIAIIPLNSAFRAFRLLRFAKFLKLLKLTKFLRVGAFFVRLLTNSLDRKSVV